MRNLVQSFQRFDSVARLATLVELESPSRDKVGLDALGALLAMRLREAGASVETFANPVGGDHVLGRFGGTDAVRPALVLAHFDTVWPRGTIDKMPFRLDQDGRAFGPGVLDMKASLVIFLEVMEFFNEHNERPQRPIWALFTSDEELGSPTSRELIEELAQGAGYALVLEPALADGGLKTSRKGVGRFRLEIEGRAAHAGVAPEAGKSAIVELAHQIIRLQELQDLAAGTTINVGVVHGGTTSNVVPAHASADIDVRVACLAEESRITRALQALEPVKSEVRVMISGSFNRPPMERTTGVASLFAQARQIYRSLNLGAELTEGSSGGGSDGNYTAALGVPTLDGLGARGGGAHADDEHIVLASIPERAAFLYLLLQGLTLEP
jgi:glutamate carboxypeptidase